MRSASGLTGHADESEDLVANHVYAVSEVVGTSPEGVEDAVANAVAKASATLRNLDWFEVTGIRGQLVDGAVAHWQVTIKVGFRMED